ncbi:MAG TPA: GatB/YqeY domain-containing protein, partial [Polyangiaceae bacterium]
RKGNDDEALAILKKIVKSNEESLAHVEDPAKKAVLLEENAVLAAFLPKSLGVDEIVSALAGVQAQVKSAGNEGQATGIAMKHLKAAGATVSGKDVSEAVKRLRG